MVLTVCLNPCIDLTMHFQALRAGELNRAKSNDVSLSGKGINVAVALSRLGVRAAATGFMYSGDAARYGAHLAIEGVRNEFLELPGSVRVNVKAVDEDGSLTELNSSGQASDTAQADRVGDIIERLSPDCSAVVFSGSVPKGLPSDIYYRLGSRVRGASVAIDAEGALLGEALSLRPALIKPNLHELKTLTGMPCASRAEILRACRELISRGAQRVLCSMGKDGALIAEEGGGAYYAESPKIRVRSTVGAGDSMLAAGIASVQRGESAERILACGVAAGSAACLTEGTGLFVLEDYADLLNKIEVSGL